eukprot:1748914-Pleurochrysis_carterae.AAC.2
MAMLFEILAVVKSMQLSIMGPGEHRREWAEKMWRLYCGAGRRRATSFMRAALCLDARMRQSRSGEWFSRTEGRKQLEVRG